MNAKNIKIQPPQEPAVIWYCREYWCGDSKDGLYVNGDGYHYFEMQRDGMILKAFEYYEAEDGEEHSTPLPELIGINWYSFFGFKEEDQVLEEVKSGLFMHVADISEQAHKS